MIRITKLKGETSEFEIVETLYSFMPKLWPGAKFMIESVDLAYDAVRDGPKRIFDAAGEEHFSVKRVDSDGLMEWQDAQARSHYKQVPMPLRFEEHVR